MRRPLGAIAVVGLAAWAVSAADPADPLVDRLGHPAFAEREAAAAALLRLGPAARPALEANAAHHPDPEIRRRAADLAARLRKAAESAQYAAAPLVALDYTGVPLTAALADLRTRSGVPLLLDPAAVGNPQRPVTVRTGPLPAWQAVDEFLRAAGLVEVFRDELPVAAVVPSLPFNGPSPTTRPPAYRPFIPDDAVIVRDGRPAALPGDRGGGVRVLALPPGFRGHRVVRGTGQVVLCLDVAPLPSLRWGEGTMVRVHRAEDETGRPVTASHRTDDPPGPAISSDVALWGGGAGQVVFLNDGISYVGDHQTTRPNPRVVPVVLKTDDRSVRRLRVLEGVVAGEVTVPDQVVFAFPDLPRSVGRAEGGPHATRLTVLAYETLPGGTAVVRLRLENPNPWTTLRLGKRLALMAQGDPLLGTFAPGVRFHFADAHGHHLAPQRRDTGPAEDGVKQTIDVELTFSPRPGVGHPATLAVTGHKPVAVELPFRLADVPLP